jgi:hypothetical protein
MRVPPASRRYARDETVSCLRALSYTLVCGPSIWYAFETAMGACVFSVVSWLKGCSHSLHRAFGAIPSACQNSYKVTLSYMSIPLSLPSLIRLTFPSFYSRFSVYSSISAGQDLIITFIHHTNFSLSPRHPSFGYSSCLSERLDCEHHC